MLNDDDKKIIRQRVRVNTANMPERLHRDVVALQNQAAARGMYLSGSTKAQTARLYRQHFELWAQQVFNAHAEVIRARGYCITEELRSAVLASVELYLGQKIEEMRPAREKQFGDLIRKAPEHFALPVTELLDKFDSDLRLWGLESPIATPAIPKEATAKDKHDLFLCHASEDKETVVNPFKEAAEAEGFTCWIDQGEIRWGDRLMTKINEGLAGCRYVVVFISDASLRKNWPQAELEAAMTSEISSGQKRVLPLFITDAEKVFSQYPLLSPKLYKKWDEGLPALMDAVRDVLSGHPGWTPPSKPEEVVGATRVLIPKVPTPSEVPAWETVRSSNIAAVRYAMPKRHLGIKFVDGGEYEYSDVPESVHAGLMAAHSKGAYFHANIKDRYPYRRVG